MTKAPSSESSQNNFRTRNILITLHLSNMPGQRKLSGIYSYIGTRSNWNIRIFRTQQEVESPEFLRLLDGPLDGIIYSSAYSKPLFDRISKVNCPLVCMEHASVLFAPRKEQLTIIRNDSRAIAKAAMDTFNHHGKYASYAFVHDRETWDWSYDRAKAFRSVIPKPHGLHVFSPLKGDPDGDIRLTRFLARLPKPAALLAAHDSRALEVIQAALRANLSIPDDIAVLGIDNDQFVCDSGSVAISSIEPDHFSEGRAAARELNAMMNGTRHRKIKQINFGVRQVVIRSSTKNIMSADSLLSRIRDYVSEHAHEGITPSDVAHTLGVSLPLLYLRLKQSKSPPLARMITQRKLDFVRHLLKDTNTPIGAIAGLSGFGNSNALKNLFKAETGSSMREYRDEARASVFAILSAKQ